MPNTSDKSGQITTREELIFALSRAAELEHGLICIYLFAAYSMKRFQDEGIDPIQQDQIRNWEAVVLEVSKQEMEHLGIVCNLLNAIGAPQHFDRPNLPQSPGYYATEGAFTLEPFSKKTIKRFMEFEKPAPSSFAQGEVEGDELVPADIETTDFHTVQELYATILQGFVNLDQNPNVDLFIGPPDAQLDDTEIVVGFGNLEYGITMIEVTDLDSAQRAIQEIVEQGEGIRIDELPPTKDTRKLQQLYQKVVVNLKEMENLIFDEHNWRQHGERLVAALALQLPILKQIHELLEEEIEYLSTIYTDPEFPKRLPPMLGKAIKRLDKKKSQAEEVLSQKNPESPVERMRRIQRRVVNVSTYDVEGIVLSGFINPESHYLQFWRIYEQLKKIDYRPARNVARNPALRLHEDNKVHRDRVTIATYSYSRQVMELFNACYETTVQMLIITFSYNRISQVDRTLLINTAFFPFMTMVIRPLSEMLTQLPAHDCADDADWADGLHTGPPFEFYIDIAFLPNRKPGWTYLNERLHQIAEVSKSLTSPPKELVDFMGCRSLENLEKQMEYLHTNLVRIAENFAIGTKQ